MAVDEIADGGAVEVAAAAGGEQGVAAGAALFGEPGGEDGGGVTGEGRAPVLAAFAGAVDVGAGAEG